MTTGEGAGMTTGEGAGMTTGEGAGRTGVTRNDGRDVTSDTNGRVVLFCRGVE